MSAIKSPIEWCDASWNPCRGCTPVSPGCANCYAVRQAARQCNEGRPYAGLVQLARDVGRRHGAPKWTGAVRFVPDALTEPKSWKAPRRVFVNSMSDLFHPGFANEEIAAVYGTMMATPWHTFIVATKQTDRAASWYEWVATRGENPAEVCRAAARAVSPELGPIACASWPLPNLWLLASVEDQQRARERLPVLCRLPAAVRGVSAEPLLELVDVRPWLRRLGWVIAGGESGPRARPCAAAWIRRIVADCDAAEVPVFVKQMGARVTDLAPLADAKGGDPAEWPNDLAGRRAFPAERRVAA